MQSTDQPEDGNQSVLAGESVQTATPPTRFRRERDRIDKFEIFSRFVLTLAASAIAVTSFLVQRVDQRRAADEHNRIEVDQIRAKYIASDAARKTYEVQAAGPLISVALRGSVDQRRNALLAMERISPSVAEAVTAVLSESATTSRERLFAATVHDEASEHETVAAFMSHLTVAREFFGRGYPAEACAEFAKTWNGLPFALLEKVNYGMVTAGQESCSEPGGHPAKGAAYLQEAYKEFQTP